MKNKFTILAIDTSCDETSAAVTVDDHIVSNVISSQVALHKKYGGVVPILAQRAHWEKIDLVINEALIRYEKLKYQILNIKYQIKFKIQNSKQIQSFDHAQDKNSILRSRSGQEFKNQNYNLIFKTKKKLRDRIHALDAIAVTVGPGLAPALEVGIAKAKELAREYNKPLIAVNHMEGHLLSSFAKNSKGKNSNFKYPISNIQYPFLGLLTSGGHTQLVLMHDFGKYQLIGETLDDALGEAFDKIAKILNLGYPGGPIVEKLAKSGNPKNYPLPVPMKERKDLNFSFSGLKTAVLYLVKNLKKEHCKLSRQMICDICASFQVAAAQSLVDKLLLSIQQYKPKAILLGGGVICNLYIRKQIRKAVKNLPLGLPYSKKLFADNAGMIGVCAYFQVKRGDFVRNIEKLDRLPGLSF